MPPVPNLQVLGACAALLIAPCVALAQSAAAPPFQAAPASASSTYERLRLNLKAARVQSPDQARELRASLSGGAIEFSARVAGVMSNRRGRVVLLQYGEEKEPERSIILAVSTAMAADAESMRSLKADAKVRILALVSPGEAEPMLVMLAATDKLAPPALFRDQDGGGVEILAPVNGALPLPPPGSSGVAPSARPAPSLQAPESSPTPEPFVQLPRARVPAKPRTPLVRMPPSTLKAAPPTSLTSRAARAPRAHLAPPVSIPRPRAVPSIAPRGPEIMASAQKRAPRARAAQPVARPRPQAPASEPMMFADDERVESQMPAYRSLVRRFNKKLSEALVEEIAHGLLTAAYSQNMDPRFLAAIVAVESDFDPRCLSSSGAMGLGQVMPFNFPEVGMTKADAWNPTKNLLATAMLLRGHLDDFKSRPNGTLLAVAAYNAGPNAVKRAGYKVPKGAQVQRYVWKVYYRYKEFAPELFQ